MPKFGVAPTGSSALLKIRNYIEWCTLLRDQVERNDGHDFLEWTPLLLSGMEEIYDLKHIQQVPFPIFLGSFRSKSGELYTVGFQGASREAATQAMDNPQTCVICLDNDASFVMVNRRHLTHCESCRLAAIEHDRTSKGQHHQGFGLSQKLSKKALASYAIRCPICRKVGKLAQRMGGNVFIP